jgi:hypothetical protein
VNKITPSKLLGNTIKVKEKLCVVLVQSKNKRCTICWSRGSKEKLRSTWCDDGTNRTRIHPVDSDSIMADKTSDIRAKIRLFCRRASRIRHSHSVQWKRSVFKSQKCLMSLTSSTGWFLFQFDWCKYHKTLTIALTREWSIQEHRWNSTLNTSDWSLWRISWRCWRRTLHRVSTTKQQIQIGRRS